MKPLVKPDKELYEEQSHFEALCEDKKCDCYQACAGKVYSDEEDDEILF